MNKRPPLTPHQRASLTGEDLPSTSRPLLTTTLTRALWRLDRDQKKTMVQIALALHGLSASRQKRLLLLAQELAAEQTKVFRTGSPKTPTPAQVEALKKLDDLAKPEGGV